MSLRDLTVRFEPLAWGLPLVGVVVGLMALVAWLAPPPPPIPLRVAIGPWTGYEPLVLAREVGTLPPGLRLVETISNTESTQLLHEGLVDAAGVTLDEAIRLASDGVDLRIIAMLSDSRGADALVVRPGILNLAELRGKRVLVEDTAVGQLLLDRALAEVGVGRNEVRESQVQASYLTKRWREGDAAAAVVYEPFLSELTAEGAVPMFSTADHPGLVLDVLVVRTAVLQDRRDDLESLLRTWGQAVSAYRTPDTLPLDILTADGRMDAAAYRRALSSIALLDLQESHAYLSGSPSSLQTAIDELVSVMQAGPLGADLRLRSGLVDASVVEAALQARAPGQAPW